MSDSERADRSVSPRGGDPLAAMYVIAALLMGVAAITVVVLMFVPTDRYAAGGDGVWIPNAAGRALPSILAAEGRPGVREIGPGRYLAVISAYNWEFEPKEIRVPVGSEVTFRVRAVEDYHGFAIVGTSLALSLGRSDWEEASHTFEEPGEYLIVCSEYCGAGHAAMTARVVVDKP